MVRIQVLLTALAAYATATPVSPDAAADAIARLERREGACGQGTCPDTSAYFDLIWTQRGASSQSRIRNYDVNCAHCASGPVGRDNTGHIEGGCWEFSSCGHNYQLCVDPGRMRASRVFHDQGHRKECYEVKRHNLGPCNNEGIQNMVILRSEYKPIGC